jgi:hypothetical protein
MLRQILGFGGMHLTDGAERQEDQSFTVVADGYAGIAGAWNLRGHYLDQRNDLTRGIMTRRTQLTNVLNVTQECANAKHAILIVHISLRTKAVLVVEQETGQGQRAQPEKDEGGGGRQ